MTTRNIILQFTNFDFDKTDRAFLERHIESKYPPAVRQMNATLRQYLRERSYNPAHNVYYDLRSNVEDDAVVRIVEVGTVAEGSQDIVTLTMEKTHRESISKLAHAVSKDEALAAIDSTFTHHNLVTDKKHLSVLSSLRPLLRDIISKVDEVYVICTGRLSWEFQFVQLEEGDSQYANSIKLEVHYHNFMGER